MGRDADWIDPRRESALESLSYGEMICHGLPLPLLQLPISTPQGEVYPDFLWPEARLIGEADGISKDAAPTCLPGRSAGRSRWSVWASG